MMSGPSDIRSDGTVTFLPHRLNRQPVIVRGLTADELWITVGLSGLAGFILGVPLAWLTRSIAMAPTAIMVAIAAGIFIGGGMLRRSKRGRPDTWLYRQVQWGVRQRMPLFCRFVGGADLVLRDGCWSTHRSRP